MSYWQDRMASAQDAISQKHIKDIDKQMAKYYKKAMERTIADFEVTYDKLLTGFRDGINPTPADLYKLDRYWKMQAQLRKELEGLGNKQASLLSKAFERCWYDIYNSISLPSEPDYSTIDSEVVNTLINEIWVADGKSFSQRIWENTQDLLNTLNEELVQCVVTGKSTNELKHKLVERFGVSFRNADKLVRTETAHIQTQAARQRYKDYGIKEVEVWADEDERRCEVCGKLHQKKYPVNGAMPIPAHPNCRCCIIPVVDDIQNVQEVKVEQPEKIVNKFGQEVKVDKRLKEDKWKNSIRIINKLNTEYESRITSIGIGSTNGAGTTDLSGAIRLSSASADVALHEYAHSINISALSKLNVEDTKEFWKEIQAIRRKYKKNIGTDTTKWISSYANKDIDEFMAEAFTHAKAKEMNIELPSSYGNDYTYSKEVLEVIDKYFKKKKKKKKK